MKKVISIICVFYLILLIGCKKTEIKATSTINIKHSPIKYLKFIGLDGIIILSTESAMGWQMSHDYQNGIISWKLDTFAVRDEIEAFFPNSVDGTIMANAGVISYNWHGLFQGSDLSYFMLGSVDSFSFNANSSFNSSWNVHGSSSFPGFTDTKTNDYFPSYFHFSLDSVISKSAGYTINLNVGTSLSHADSIVYMIYDFVDPTISTVKVMSSSVLNAVFTSTDLSIFTLGHSVCIQAVAYNYRVTTQQLN